jgi:hypothetical protein
VKRICVTTSAQTVFTVVVKCSSPSLKPKSAQALRPEATKTGASGLCFCGSAWIGC